MGIGQQHFLIILPERQAKAESHACNAHFTWDKKKVGRFSNTSLASIYHILILRFLVTSICSASVLSLSSCIPRSIWSVHLQFCTSLRIGLNFNHYIQPSLSSILIQESLKFMSYEIVCVGNELN